MCFDCVPGEWFLRFGSGLGLVTGERDSDHSNLNLVVADTHNTKNKATTTRNQIRVETHRRCETCYASQHDAFIDAPIPLYSLCHMSPLPPGRIEAPTKSL